MTPEEALINDCEESLIINSTFHKSNYQDNCYCKKNLEYVIETIVNENQNPQRWIDLILRNNKNKSKCNHIWIQKNIEKI